MYVHLCLIVNVGLLPRLKVLTGWCVCGGGMLMIAKPSFPEGTLGWDKCGDGNPLDTLGGGSVFDYPHCLAEDPALGYM